MWWSMEPPSINILKSKDPCEQVLEQVDQINILIKNDSEQIGRDRFIEIEYDDLCNDVHGQLSRINNFLISHNVEIFKRTLEIRAQFTEREELNIPEELIQKVRNYSNKM